MTYSKSEDALLLKLRSKNVPFKEVAELMSGHTQDALRNRAYQLRQLESKKNWADEERIAFFDIETSSFEADVGVCLSWSIKERGKGKVLSAVISKKELFDGKLDRRVVQEFIDAIKDYDLLVGYYSTKFDLAFMRTRALMLGMEFPGYGTIKHHDLYYTARAKLKLHSNRLASLQMAFGTKESKTTVDIGIWAKARYGDAKALKYVDTHCRKDILVLEEVFEKLKPFVKMNRKSI